MQLKPAFLLLYIFLFRLFSAAQPGLIHFKVKEGLSQNSVTCIFRDSRGFVWIGTQDGLNRFDGYQFSQYKYNAIDTNSISDQYVTAINEDGDGNIWVGTRNGLNVVDISTHQFRRIHPDPLGKRVIQYEFNDIVATANGNLIIKRGGEILFWENDLKELKTYGILYPHGNFSVYGNDLWSIDDDGNVSLLDLKKGFPVKKRKSSSIYLKQFIDRQHTIWYAQISAENRTVISFYDLQTGLWKKNVIALQEEISHISFDKNNQAWISTKKGLFIADSTGSLRQFTVQDVPVNISVLSTFTDKDGLSWIGFAQNGLGLYNPDMKVFSLFTSGKQNDPVFCSGETINGELLMGAASGLYIINPVTKIKKQILQEKITAIATDSKQNTWVASEKAGIYILNKEKRIIKKIDKQSGILPDNLVFNILYDSRGKRMFISTVSGLIVWNEEDESWKMMTDKRAKEPGILAGSYQLHSFIDSKKNIWLSSNGGLDMLDDQLNGILQFNSNNDSASAIKRTIITGCTEDGLGNIWIATLSNGIYRYQNKKILQYNTDSGLSSNVVYGVLSDKMNRIWIATSNGINVFDQRSNMLVQLTEKDGLPARDYMLSSFRYGNQDDFFIASPEGLIRIEPLKFEIKKRKLLTHIHSVFVNYEPARIEDHYMLNEEDRVISFEFTAPGIINAEKINYEYRLKGFDNNWVRVNADNRRINFTNLPYSNFQLELRSAYSIRELEEAPVTTIFISRKPPFWRSPIFVVFIIFFILVLLIFSVRYFTKQKMEKKLRAVELEQTLYKERERISRDLHDNLGAYAAAIKSNVVQLTREKNSERFIEQLTLNAEEMVNALRETIWALQYQYISITSVSDRFKDLLNRISPSYPGIQLQVKENIQKEIQVSPAEGIHLLRIMQEAVTNALKHAQASMITVTINSADSHSITIADNGKGFDLTLPSKGHGIENMKQRSEEAGFQFLQETSTTGTTITIKKPAI